MLMKYNITMNNSICLCIWNKPCVSTPSISCMNCTVILCINTVWSFIFITEKINIGKTKKCYKRKMSCIWFTLHLQIIFVQVYHTLYFTSNLFTYLYALYYASVANMQWICPMDVRHMHHGINTTCTLDHIHYMCIPACIQSKYDRLYAHHMYSKVASM